VNFARRFSPARFWAIVTKEFVQMRRDRLTFAMMIGIPLMQLTLFGLVINSDPKHLPTALLIADHGPQVQTILYAIRNTSYFDFVKQVQSEDEANELLARGEVQFVVNVPEDFSRKLLRGESPALLIEADATDPAATSNALGTFGFLLNTALRNDLKGALGFLAPGATATTTPGSSATAASAMPPPVELRVHARYNPEAITQYNIVPGLMGVVLTMTMVMINALAITRERERGTMENLLSMPARPFEVMTGKILPYILVGYIQLVLILLAAHFLFRVPIAGSLPLLFAAALLFIAANLAIGITISTLASNQMQAMQMSFFVFLPSILLSGFMFPFRGMPLWAQWLGEVLPNTHFLRIVRGILLKGNGAREIAPELWQLALFTVVVLAIGVKRYRQTLD
jgi:ABC-2 type transport system permease protein